MVSSSSSEQPTEVSLCHLTSNPVTTEPLGTLPVIVMAVDEGDVVSESSAADGAEREKLGDIPKSTTHSLTYSEQQSQPPVVHWVVEQMKMMLCPQ